MYARGKASMLLFFRAAARLFSFALVVKHGFDVFAKYKVPGESTKKPTFSAKGVMIRRAFAESERGIISQTLTQTCLCEYRRQVASQCRSRRENDRQPATAMGGTMIRSTTEAAFINHGAPGTRVIAGVRRPDNPLIRAATASPDQNSYH